MGSENWKQARCPLGGVETHPGPGFSSIPQQQRKQPAYRTKHFTAAAKFRHMEHESPPIWSAYAPLS